MKTEKIPLIIGVTGHRQIRQEDRPVLLQRVCTELEKLKELCPHTDLAVMSCLAEGADQLCAEAAAQLSIPLIAALPMAQADYEEDFSEGALGRFRAGLKAAQKSFVVPPAEKEPAGADRDFAYRQAGIYVAEHSQLLLALWDGEAGRSGCGTAETVSFALQGAFCPAEGVTIKKNGFVLQIQTPRAGGDGAMQTGTVRFLGDEAAFREILARTDEWNELAEGLTGENKPLLPADRKAEPVLDRMERLYFQADELSLRFARRYRRTLAALAVISTVITVAFLLYDEAELHAMILLCGLMFLAAWLTQHLAKKSASHRRYLEYRTLAEVLRVQSFLLYAGSRTQVSSILPWSVQMETGWVAAALQALTVGAKPQAGGSIRECWVEDQRCYHEKALEKARHTRGGSDRIVRAAFTVSIVLYLATLVFELFWGGLLSSSGPYARAETVRAIVKLLLGSASAATLFMANYFGKLSLSRSVSDHEKMAQFYLAVRAWLDREGQTEALLRSLAREELIENANWCSYQRDNGADFSL